MATPNESLPIKQVRRELLVVLKVVYPASLSADVLYRALLGAFVHMEWEYLRKDLAYLVEKGYLIRRDGSVTHAASADRGRRSLYRLSPAGVELVDRCTNDAALEV
jgi:hypothetical protein